jgi:predicted MFS family arabinose efflux permease
MHRNMVLILITFGLNFVRWGMVFPLIPLLAHDQGASPAMIGVVVGTFGLLSLFLSVPLGGFTDRIGTKRVFILGALCNMASALLLLRVTHIMTLIASQILGGLGFQLYIVSGQTFIARLDSPLKRESGFGYLTFSAALGQSLGPVMGGLIASRFDYHTAFLMVLLISTLGLLILGFRESNRPRGTDRYSLRRDLQYATTILSDSRMLAVLAFTFVIMFAVSLRMSFLPVLLLNRGSSKAIVGLLISLLAVMSTLVRPFVGRLLQVFSRRNILAFCILTVAFGVGLIPLLSSVFTVALALCTFGMGFGLAQPLSMMMVADLTVPEHSGLSMGIRFMVITFANSLGPVLLGVLVEHLGLDAVFYVSAFTVIATGAYIVSWKSKLVPERREEI